MKSLLVLMGFLVCGAARAQADRSLFLAQVVSNEGWIAPSVVQKEDGWIRTAAHSVEEKESVAKPIKLLLEALQKGDSALLHQAFTNQVTMAFFGTDKDGKVFARYESSLDGLLKRVGTPHTEVDNEVIWDEKVLVDENLAQVWTNYAFYNGKKFSHCGVNAFHLTKVDGSWKIFHLAFTRQREGCKIPNAISKQFE